MRGWVCSFQLLLAITSTIFLGLSPAGLMSIFYYLYFLDSPNPEVQVFISPRNRVAQLYPRALCWGDYVGVLQGQGQGYITTNNQSVSMSWYRAQSRTIDQSLLSP
jgi:hypothetical protein